MTVKGKITKLVPYGAFVEVAEGVEGLIHVSELSWTKRITRPSDVLELGQDVEAVVLGINIEEQKISLVFVSLSLTHGRMLNLASQLVAKSKVKLEI